MIRILAVLCMLFAGYSQASAEMARAPKPKPTKEVSASGCIVVGLEGCHLLQLGKERVGLTANPGVVIPPARTFIVAKGKFEPVEWGFCGVKRRLHASSIIATKRKC